MQQLKHRSSMMQADPTDTASPFTMGIPADNQTLPLFGLDSKDICFSTLQICGSGVRMQVELVPETVLQKVDKFHICYACGKVFWYGPQYTQTLGHFEHHAPATHLGVEAQSDSDETNPLEIKSSAIDSADKLTCIQVNSGGPSASGTGEDTLLCNLEKEMTATSIEYTEELLHSDVSSNQLALRGHPPLSSDESDGYEDFY